MAILSKTVRNGVLASACLVTLGGSRPPEDAPTSGAPIAAPTEQAYDLPAQPLNAALARYASLSGVDILYDHALAANRRSTAFSGSYTPQQAILTLLRGTGLAARFTGRKAAVIYELDHPDVPGAAPASKELDLDVMHVVASPLIGAPVQLFDSYGRAAQADIYRRIAAEPSMKGLVFRLDLCVRLDAEGAIRQARVTRSSGDPTLDQKVLALLDGARLSQPPAGLPQPLRFRVAQK